jgi:KDO2-lipid IV(A) lauroyltransferase
MLSFFSKLLSFLPLAYVHTLGTAIGWTFNLLSSKSAKNRHDNLKQSGLCLDDISFQHTLKQNIRETGKAILETLVIWRKDNDEILNLVKNVYNWQAVEQALARGTGIIFLTPHMGCFEITSLYYALHHPISVLYRPPKLKWLEPMIIAGRERNNVKLAPANMQGVKTLMQALKRGEAIGILPDQIPQTGEGDWAPFFGKPAYTMSLASKLAEKTGATVIMAFGERLADGAGFAIHLTKLDDHAIATPALLNAALEEQIKQCPSQYYWNYHRYKVSRKSKPLPIEGL